MSKCELKAWRFFTDLFIFHKQIKHKLEKRPKLSATVPRRGQETLLEATTLFELQLHQGVKPDLHHALMKNCSNNKQHPTYIICFLKKSRFKMKYYNK
jgi:hypothetical protein